MEHKMDSSPDIDARDNFPARGNHSSSKEHNRSRARFRIKVKCDQSSVADSEMTEGLLANLMAKIIIASHLKQDPSDQSAT
jgi:hypothetical protein